jgi:hypothetical protein
MEPNDAAARRLYDQAHDAFRRCVACREVAAHVVYSAWGRSLSSCGQRGGAESDRRAACEAFEKSFTMKPDTEFSYNPSLTDWGRALLAVAEDKNGGVPARLQAALPELVRVALDSGRCSLTASAGAPCYVLQDWCVRLCSAGGSSPVPSPVVTPPFSVVITASRTRAQCPSPPARPRARAAPPLGFTAARAISPSRRALVCARVASRRATRTTTPPLQ